MELDRVSPDPYDTVASANALRSELSFGSQQKFVQPEQKPITNKLKHVPHPAAQFTKRRSRTLFTSPSIKKVDSVFEPPALMSGRGMPVTGILPTTIPTFTNK